MGVAPTCAVVPFCMHYIMRTYIYVRLIPLTVLQEIIKGWMGVASFPGRFFWMWPGNEARMGNVGMMTQQFKVTACWLR